VTPLTWRRDDIDALKSQLASLGADHVLTYDEFLKGETRAQIKEWTSDGEMRLALNCVGGKETSEMVKLLSMSAYLGKTRRATGKVGCGAMQLAKNRNVTIVAVWARGEHRPRVINSANLSEVPLLLVTYGGMAKTALSIPPSLFIFKKLTA
jgi:hypothetical protein